jgi:hypothetical protein
MYDTIVLSNGNTLNFTIVFDKINFKTSAILKLYDKEFISELPADSFYMILGKINNIIYLPSDPLMALYKGPEIKIRVRNSSSDVIWSNMNLKNEYDNSFRVNDIVVLDENQKKYDNHVAYLLQLADKIFSQKINKN